MVDVSDKSETDREAEASAKLTMRAEVLTALLRGELPKGDATATARIAGILAAKQTSQLIPLCHPLPLSCIRIDFESDGPGEMTIRCVAKTSAKTGVEMEALTGVTIAALTLYDMAKAADKAITIGPIQLERKSGGKSGEYLRATRSDPSR